MKREALVVGINRYPFLKDKITGEPKHRTTPAPDAEAVAQLLEKHGNFHVRRFPVKGSEGTWQVDPHPPSRPAKRWTAKDLEDAITELFYPPGEPPETAVLFFAGHGLRKSGTVSEGFLGTSDALPEKGRWGVSLRWLRELLENSPVRQQVVWLDCCFSGELLNLAEADPGLRGKNRNRCFIAASREFEPAFEEFGGQHGVLSGALLQGLDPTQRPDGLVTNYTLTDFIENQLRSARQRPVWKNWGGEIILTGKKEKINNPALMGRCPYKGLEYFNDNEEDAQFFHGRQELTQQLRQKVDKGNFLAVLGSSGIGKTSVVRAGLLYQLRQGKHLSGSDQWEIRTFRPGKNPLQSLAAVFTDPKLPADEWSQQFAAAQAMVNIGGVGLHDLVSQIDAPRLVLVADQFEEAFTLCENQAERQQFFECLLGAVREPDAKLCVVLVMRADFFSKCAERDYGGLAAQIEEHLVTVRPMSPQELEEAIVAPAKQVGLDIERELITEMIDEVKDAPGSLPLLQYTLTELWKQRELDCLRLSKYRALGGVKGALEKRANEVYHSLSRDEQKVAKRIFLELTHLGEGTEDTRRQVFLEDLVTRQPSKVLVDKVIKKLADEKLVVTGEVKALGEARVAVVEVAHEALIRHWSLLRGWINENREAIRRQREIEEAARDWRNRGKPKDAAYLLQGTKLNLAEDFVKNQAEMAEIVELSDIGREFVQRSIQHRRNSRIRLTGSVIGVITLLSGATIFANIQRIEAERNATIANLREKAVRAENLLTTEPVDGLVLAIQATGESQDKLGQVLSSVQDILLSSLETAREQNRFQGHQDLVNSVVISPDGETIVSGSYDDTLRLWNYQGENIAVLRGHQKYVSDWALFSLNDDNTVRLSNSQMERLNDIRKMTEDLNITRHYDGSFNAVVFSKDGEVIFGDITDNTMRLWNQQWKKIGELRGNKQGFNAVAFSSDGRDHCHWQSRQYYKFVESSRRKA
jgi:energy-coupling factor transporter ATP-binding protein EcfA2